VKQAQTNAALAVAAISSAEAARAAAAGVSSLFLSLSPPLLLLPCFIKRPSASDGSDWQAQVTDTRNLYAGLGLEEFLCDDFMGLDVSQQAIVAQMPREVAVIIAPGPVVSTLPGQHAIASITPKGDVNLRRAEIKQGVREVVLAKDSKGKLGLAVKSIDKGVFVSFVWQGSAASLAGVRFCDQILQVSDLPFCGTWLHAAFMLDGSAGRLTARMWPGGRRSKP
jgi:hypothetical protein